MRAFVLLLVFLTSCVIEPIDLNDVNNHLGKVMMYDDIVIEVLPTISYSPSKDFQSEFKKRLENFGMCKAENIRFAIQKAPKTTHMEWTYSLIRLHESMNRVTQDKTPEDRHLVVFVSCLDGVSIQIKRLNIVGLLYGDTSIAYFTSRPDHELSIWLHEFGHLVGLVDRKYRDSPPTNPDRPSHCNNKKCIMFWRCGGIELDVICRNDLQRIKWDRWWVEMKRIREVKSRHHRLKSRFGNRPNSRRYYQNK